MEFISTKGMTNDNAPIGKVLVQYLEPSWGFWSVDFAIGYFDNGDGWKHWNTENKINVLAYAILPEEIESDLTKVSQKDFVVNFGGSHPNFGCVGE